MMDERRGESTSVWALVYLRGYYYIGRAVVGLYQGALTQTYWVDSDPSALGARGVQKQPTL